jgi:predicted lipid-binding transport protein (Tim44 family)
MGLENYADGEIETLSALISTEAMAAFRSEVDSMRTHYDNENW